MATKMLWEVKAPLYIAKAKEDMGMDNIFKYLRYYKMYMERFKWRYKGVDMTHRIENLLFWRGQVALVNDIAYGLVVAEIDEKKTILDANGNIKTITVSAENGYKRNNIEVGKDAIILYADETHLAPVLYVWAIANNIIDVEDIISQQNNMLRKPIMITGEGEELDNAMAKVSNILSGVAWFNFNPKKKGDIMNEKPAEVLNLQVGNAYKGTELWESRSHYEELIRDYLGYSSVNNEKKERMIVDEVNQTNSICDTFYKTAVAIRKEIVNKVEGLEFINMLEKDKEVKDNDSQEELE